MDYSLKYKMQSYGALEVQALKPEFDGLWLPKKEELQSSLKFHDIDTLIDSFQIFWEKNIYNGYYYSNTKFFDSAEQLWLAYAMYSLANKVWNGGEWVKYYKRNKLFYRMGKVCGIICSII